MSQRISVETHDAISQLVSPPRLAEGREQR